MQEGRVEEVPASKQVQAVVPDAPAVLARLRRFVDGWVLPGMGTEGPLWMRMVEAPEKSTITVWFARVLDDRALYALLRCNPTSQHAMRIALMREWKWHPKAMYALVDREKMVDVLLPLHPDGATYEVVGMAVAQVCYMTHGDPEAALTAILNG